MSAIFGFVNLDGRPASRQDLQAMASAMGHWGPDGVKTTCGGTAAFGHALLAVAPESRHEAMPYHHRESDLVLTAAARLDNRDELLDLFAIPAAGRPSFPDGRLVFLSYERWREDSPAHLFGDWSFAAWHGRERRLFMARDRLGNTGLFYCHKPPLFAFASTPRAILALPGFPARLDEWRLARYLTVFPGRDADRDRTFWEDVRQLLPAHQAAVTPGALKATHYWRLEDIPSVRFGSDEAYLEGFRHHFREAVRVRLRADRPVGCQLSAGLDSGSVTALAAGLLQADGRNLPALTSVPVHSADHLAPGALSDEWPLAHTVALKYPNVGHVAVSAADIPPLRAVHDGLRICGQPLHAAANRYWIQAIYEAARQRGLGVLLTGQMGNGGVSWSGGRDRIFFLLARGKWHDGLRALRAFKRKRGCSWHQAIRRHLLSPFLGPLRRQFAERLWAQYSAIHPDFVRRLNLREAMRAEGHAPSFSPPWSPDQERRLTIEINAPLLYIPQHYGSAFGMEVRDPTADVRLVTFCFGAPDELHNRGGGERMLLRRSLAGVLPEEVRTNNLRGRQAADLALRLLDYRQEMKEELAALATHGSVGGYLDVTALQEAWENLQAQITPDTSQKAGSLLLRGIMAGRFIMDLAKDQ